MIKHDAAAKVIAIQSSDSPNLQWVPPFWPALLLLCLYTLLIHREVFVFA